MDLLHYAAIASAVAVAGFVQGATGVSFALIVAPVIGLLEPRLLPVCLLVLMLPLNAYVLWRERFHIDRLGAGWITAGRIAGTLGGMWVLVMLSQNQLNLFVGLTTLVAVFLSLVVPEFRPTKPAYLAAGVVTGVTETATGIGGPPLALVYQHHPPSIMRSTVATCFLLGELISLTTLLLSHRVEVYHIRVAAELLPPLLVGIFASHKTYHRVNGRFLRYFVLLFAAVSSVALLLR